MSDAPSTDELVTALEQAGAPAWLTDRARRHHFHDFRSHLAMPNHALVAALRAAAMMSRADTAARLRALVSDVVAGRFDATKAEADAWAASPEGQAATAQYAKIFDRPKGTQ